MEAVRQWRERSRSGSTRALAAQPWLFGVVHAPQTPFLAVPLEALPFRNYLPTAMLDPEVVAARTLGVVRNASLLTFGLVSSRAFWVWARAHGGAPEDEVRVSIRGTYNTFPVPYLDAGDIAAIESAAGGVLESRSYLMTHSLAALYEESTMPMPLRHAHDALDGVVSTAYGLPSPANDEEMLERLMDLHGEQSSLVSASQ